MSLTASSDPDIDSYYLPTPLEEFKHILLIIHIYGDEDNKSKKDKKTNALCSY